MLPLIWCVTNVKGRIAEHGVAKEQAGKCHAYADTLKVQAIETCYEERPAQGIVAEKFRITQ